MTKPAKIVRTFDESLVRKRIEKGRRARWWRRIGSTSKTFKYLDINKQPITDEKQLQRIRSLVIPPAWKYVRISPARTSTLQAIGMDSSGRIQYLYHPDFAAKQQQKKFAKIEKFGRYLPALRRLTNEHIMLEGLPREKVLAVMLRLINSLYIRVGTEKSVKQYKTYGITTLQNRHLDIKRGGKLVFNFVGKHHIRHRKVLVDDELAAVLKELKKLGAARKLFHYLDEAGHPRPIKPQHINEYLKTATSSQYSVKDFRTWGGSLLAAIELAEIGKAENETELKKNIVKAVKKVAEQLGNTPAVCRSAYIHPVILKSYESGITLNELRPRKLRRITRIEAEYEIEEKALMKLFQIDRPVTGDR